MRTGRTIPSLIPCLLLVSPWAFAQSPAPSLEVFLEGGGSFSTSTSGTEILTPPCPSTGCAPISVSMTGSFSETIHPTAGARYRFTRHDALEATYTYSPYHFFAQPAGQSALAGYNRADLYSFNYVRYLSAKARVQPFVTFGLGTNRFSGPSNAPAVVNGYVKADNGWQFASNGGGGADLVLERHFALRMDLRVYTTRPPRVIGPSHTVTGLGTSDDVVSSLGIVFRFK